MNGKLTRHGAHQLVNLLQQLVGFIDLDHCHGPAAEGCTKQQQKDCVRKITDYINANLEIQS